MYSRGSALSCASVSAGSTFCSAALVNARAYCVVSASYEAGLTGAANEAGVEVCTNAETGGICASGVAEKGRGGDKSE